MNYFNGGWPRYVPVAELHASAMRKIKELKKKGKICHPVEVGGRCIVDTFWGKKWCQHLEAYSDYANRLPRGRSYVRHGSVIDLKIAAGKITALVVGATTYRVSIEVSSLDPKLWQIIIDECAGKVASLVELLQGRLSSAVMEVVTRPKSGLFPSPEQISFHCSCPDSAFLCKHIAATLYGIGVRFDRQPELLFLLRDVEPQELILQAGRMPVANTPTVLDQQLDTSDLSTLFGIELNTVPLDSHPSMPTLKTQHKTNIEPPFDTPQVIRSQSVTKGKDKTKSAKKKNHSNLDHNC